VIRSGKVVDGTGRLAFVADVAVKDGLICGVGPDLPVQGREEFDAHGRLVTPGWIDAHTHYDAQWSWDPYLTPSSTIGVTTCIMGNCGIGFAPCQKDRRNFLAHLVEAVEDIPERIIAAGLNYDFETFEEYLQSLERTPLGCDVGVLVGHTAVRTWVMGERANLSDTPGGPAKHPLTEREVESMASIVRDAVASGAFGFSTTRLLLHRDPEGTLAPGSLSSTAELKAIASAVAAGGGGVFEMASDWMTYDDVPADKQDKGQLDAYRKSEYEWMMDVTRQHGRNVAFSFNCAPNSNFLVVLQQINHAGGFAIGQCTARAQGLLQAFGSRAQPFKLSMTYNKIEKECQENGLDLIAALRQSGKREVIIKEADWFFKSKQTGHLQSLQDFFRPFSDHFPWTASYEPDTCVDSIEAIAHREGRTLFEVYYDHLINGGVVWKPFFNSYTGGNYNMTCAFLNNPCIIPGFADAGAHGTVFQDAPIASFMLAHLVRDRTKGPKMSLEHVVKVNTSEVAKLFGLDDRGTIAVGKKADINVIDFDRLRMGQPYVAKDMPLAQDRWLQDVDGYCLTLLSGQPTVRHGRPTGARPGRLVRNPKRIASAWQGLAWEVAGDLKRPEETASSKGAGGGGEARGGASAAARIFRNTIEDRSRL